jgi:hypothetical protein
VSREELVDALAEAAHEAWIQGCIVYGIKSRKSAWGEEFMVEWEQLSDPGREFDRIVLRGILAKADKLGFKLVKNDN